MKNLMLAVLAVVLSITSSSCSPDSRNAAGNSNAAGANIANRAGATPANAAASPAAAPTLNRAELFTQTNDDNKDHDTGVYVDVFTSNGATKLANIENADNCDSDACEYNDGSRHTVVLNVLSPGSTKDDCQGFKAKIKSKANGNDKWKIKKATVTLYFSDGTNLVKERSDFELNSRGSNFSNEESIP